MANEVNEVIDVFGEGIGELGKNSTDTWWYPKPENQHGKPWITDEATQSELGLSTLFNPSFEFVLELWKFLKF